MHGRFARGAVASLGVRPDSDERVHPVARLESAKSPGEDAGAARAVDDEAAVDRLASAIAFEFDAGPWLGGAAVVQIDAAHHRFADRRAGRAGVVQQQPIEIGTEDLIAGHAALGIERLDTAFTRGPPDAVAGRLVEAGPLDGVERADGVEQFLGARRQRFAETARPILTLGQDPYRVPPRRQQTSDSGSSRA